MSVCIFESRVARLHSLLRERKVSAGDGVQVGNLRVWQHAGSLVVDESIYRDDRTIITHNGSVFMIQIDAKNWCM